jgi:hypothetical protein
MGIENCELRWRLTLDDSLTVLSYSAMPQTNMHLPCLFSRNGGPHPAFFTIERIDSDFEELYLSFSGDSLLSMTDEIEVIKFEDSL